MYTFKQNINKKDYDKFIYENNASFMQEKGWAKVKNNWDNIICGAYENKKLVATCSILIRKIFKNITMFYIPRGFVLDYENKELLEFFTNSVKGLAKEKDAYLVKIDPYFCNNEFLFKDKNKTFSYLSKNFNIKHQNLLNLGFIHTGFNKDMKKTFQPRYNMAVPLVDIDDNQLTYQQLLKTFKSKFRYYLGDYHAKRGVYFTRSYNKKDLKKFVEMLKHTEKNKSIKLRDINYFERIMDNFPERICLLFGKVNLEKYLKFLEENNQNSKEIEMVKELIHDNGNELTLSSALLLLPDTKDFRCSEYLYAGNNLILNKLNVSGGIALEAAKVSIENNCQYCNLGGIDGNLNDPLATFKSKYNAVVLEFAGEYDLIINKPLYFIITKFKPLLTKIYKLIKK